MTSGIGTLQPPQYKNSNMPKCFLGSVKRQWSVSKVRNDPNVMITRSGLSIPRILNGQNALPTAYLASPTQLATSVATNQYYGQMLLEPYLQTIAQEQDQHHNNSSVLYKSYKSNSSTADSLSVVTRYELLQDGITIESKDINSTNQPSRFLVTREQLMGSFANACDTNVRANNLWLDYSPLKAVTQPQLSDLAYFPDSHTKITHMTSIDVPGTPTPPDDDGELDLIPLPLVIDVPMLANSLDESTDTSTCSSDSVTVIQRSNGPVVSASSRARLKSQHPLLELLESLGEIKIYDLSPVELKNRIQPFIMPSSCSGGHPSLFKCAICRKVYGGVQAFAEHVNSHLKLKNRCHVCGRVFTRHWLLKGHLRVHTGEKPFSCDICGKSFADRSNLRSHVLIHTATNKSHQCTKCGKSFTLKRYLQKHSLEVCKLDIKQNL